MRLVLEVFCFVFQSVHHHLIYSILSYSCILHSKLFKTSQFQIIDKIQHTAPSTCQDLNHQNYQNVVLHRKNNVIRRRLDPIIFNDHEHNQEPFTQESSSCRRKSSQGRRKEAREGC